jgi:hypothetical protein
MGGPAIPQEVEALLGWWLPGVRGLLGPNLRSVVLHGSAALGDFLPGWSDVDVCVILDEPITEDEGRAIGALHDEMAQRSIEHGADGWRSGQAIEGPYVPLPLAGDPNAVAPCYAAGGTTRRYAVGHPVTPFDRYTLAHFGRTLTGPDVEFAPPSRASLVEQGRADLRLLAEPHPSCLDAPIWMAGITHWLARSMVFWRDGVMLSKTAALQQEITGGSPFARAFEMALALRMEGSAACAGREEELRANFLSVAPSAANMLGGLIRE